MYVSESKSESIMLSVARYGRQSMAKKFLPKKNLLVFLKKTEGFFVS